MASIKHEDFAELIGVHKNTLSGYLRGASCHAVFAC